MPCNKIDSTIEKQTPVCIRISHWLRVHPLYHDCLRFFNYLSCIEGKVGMKDICYISWFSAAIVSLSKNLFHAILGFPKNRSINSKDLLLMNPNELDNQPVDLYQLCHTGSSYNVHKLCLYFLL